MSEADISNVISVAMEDKVSKPLGKINETLTSTVELLTKLGKKFDDISKTNLSTLAKEIDKVKNASVDLKSPAGRFSVSKDSKASQKSIDKAIDAHSDSVAKQTELLNKELEHFDELIAAKLEKDAAYIKDINNRISKRTRAKNLNAKTRNIDAKTALLETQNQLLQESGQRRFTNNWEGGKASMISSLNQRMKNHQGFIGLAARAGERLGADNSSWFGKKFGGVIKAGTAGGLGVNAGALALGGFITAVGGAVKAMYEFRKASLDAYGSMQKLAVNMEVVYGSKVESASAFEGIQRYATKSPFGIAQTTEMAVLLKQSGVYASELQKTLEMIGDVSSGNEEKMKRIANNYAQIQAIGHASMLDMRQFAYAGLPIYEEVAKTMGKTQAELRNMISDGKVTSEVIEKTFQRMTGEGGTFNGAVSKGSKTRAARQINMEDVKNVALSNWGESFWNAGSRTKSWEQSKMDFKEGFWEMLGSLGKSRSIDRNYTHAAVTSDRYDSLVEAYAKALADNNEPLAKSLGKELNDYKNNINSEENITASFAAKAMKDLGFSNMTRVSQEDYDDVIRRLEELLKTEGIVEYEGYNPRKLNEDEIRDLMKRAIAGESLGFVGATLTYSNIGAKAEANNYSEYLRESYSDNQFNDKLEVYAGKTKNATKATALYTTELQKMTRSADDYLNKQASLSESLAGLAAKYKSDYEKSDEGQLKKKREYEEGYNKWAKEASFLMPFWSNESHSLNKEALKKAKQDALKKGQSFSIFDTGVKMNNGFYTNATPLDLGRTSIRTNVKNTEMKQLFSNIDDAKFLFQDFGIAGEEYIDLLSDFENKFKNIGFGSTKDEVDNFTISLKKLLDVFYNSGDERIISIARTLTEKREGIDEISPMAKGNGLGDIPLWKRIFAGATGFDASKIGSRNGAQIMAEYAHNDAVRHVGAGGVTGLVSAGMSAQDVGAYLKYTKKEAQGGTRQIDWQASNARMLGDAMSAQRPIKETASMLQGLSGAMKKELQVYEKLTADMYNVGEDWSYITKLSKDEKQRLENAFAANMAVSGDSSYEMGFSAEKDNFVVTDSFFGQYAGHTIEELKAMAKSGEISDKKLISVIDKLTLKSESIVSGLDKAREAMQTLSNITEISNSIASETLRLQEEAAKVRGSYAGSEAGLNALKRTLANDRDNENSDTKYESGSALSKLNEPATKETVKSFLSDFGKTLSTMKPTQISYADFIKENPSYANSMSESDFNTLKNAAGNYQSAESSQEQNEILFSLMTKLRDVFIELIDKAANAADNIGNAETRATSDKMINKMNKNFELAGGDGWYRKGQYVDENNRSHKNSFTQQMLLNSLGTGETSFYRLSDKLADTSFTAQETYGNGKAEKIGNSEEIGEFQSTYLNKLKEYGSKALKDSGNEDQVSTFEKALNNGDMDSAVATLGEQWDSINEKTAAWVLSLGNGVEQLQQMGNNLLEMGKSAGLDAFSSSFETLGQSIAEGADSSEALTENFKKMGASLFSQAGKYLTMAGLNLAASAMGNVPMILTGLAIAAAGGGLSFLSGMLGASEKDDDKGNSELERLLKVKQDLQELLKQAREDSVYYEKTVRHKNAISANADFTTKKVNDAIITPSGDVISTHPDDYLIATKTPHSLVNAGKGGAPTINFSVVDKSTGIKVTQQKSSYDEDKNEIDFEAIIESKVTEIIATSKGDEAFNARQARINGRSVIA